MGGSARQEYVRKEKGCCFVLFSYLRIPSLVPKYDELAPLKASGSSEHESTLSSENTGPDISRHSVNSASRGNRKAPAKRSSSLISYGGTKKDGAYYALKSIHLDRCTTPEYVRELRNEGKREREVHRSNSNQLIY